MAATDPAVLDAIIRDTVVRRERERMAGTDVQVPLDVQIACVKRELRQRRSVYARLVQDGRMTEEMAVKELRAMQAVLVTLMAVLEGQQGELFGVPTHD